MKEELPEVSIEILNSEELQENYNLRVENERLRAELEGAELVNEELEKQLAECSQDYHRLRAALGEIATLREHQPQYCFTEKAWAVFYESIAKQVLKDSEGE